MKIRFVRWDWKEQPDINWLNRGIQDVYDGKNLPCVTQIDTDSDSYAIVISGKKIDENQARKIYDEYIELPDDENPCNKVLEIKWP